MPPTADVFVTITCRVQSFCPRDQLTARAVQALEQAFAQPLTAGNVATSVTMVSVAEQPAAQPLALGYVLLASPTAAVGPFASAAAAAEHSSEAAIVPLYAPDALTWRRDHDFLDRRVEELLRQFLSSPQLSAEQKRDLLCREIGEEVAELLMAADSFEDCVEWIQQHCGTDTAVSLLSRLLVKASAEDAEE